MTFPPDQNFVCICLCLLSLSPSLYSSSHPCVCVCVCCVCTMFSEIQLLCNELTTRNTQQVKAQQEIEEQKALVSMCVCVFSWRSVAVCMNIQPYICDFAMWFTNALGLQRRLKFNLQTFALHPVISWEHRSLHYRGLKKLVRAPCFAFMLVSFFCNVVDALSVNGHTSS